MVRKTDESSSLPINRRDESAASALSTEAIVGALEATRERIASTEGKIAQLEQAIAPDKQEARLLEGLLALRRGDKVSQPDFLDGSSPDTNSVGGDVGDNSRSPAVNAVVEILAEAGRPSHVSDLMRILRERSVAIPGSGTQANLISHLRRDDRIVRPSRGMYGLAVWGLPNMIPKARKRRRGRKPKRPRNA